MPRLSLRNHPVAAAPLVFSFFFIFGGKFTSLLPLPLPSPPQDRLTAVATTTAASRPKTSQNNSKPALYDRLFWKAARKIFDEKHVFS
jgi:hypothetical protein